jgi:hypothetical protein
MIRFRPFIAVLVGSPIPLQSLDLITFRQRKFFLFSSASLWLALRSAFSSCLVLIVSLSHAVDAQAQESELFRLYKSKFPDAAAAFIVRSELLTISIKNDSLQIHSDVVEDMIHLKPQTDVYSSGKVYGSHFSQVENLNAKTLVW